MGGCVSRPKDLRGEAPEVDAAAVDVSVDPAPLNSTEAPVVESMVEGEPTVVEKEEPKVEGEPTVVEKEEPKVEAIEEKNEEPKVETSESKTDDHKANQTAEVTVVEEEPPVAAADVAEKSKEVKVTTE